MPSLHALRAANAAVTFAYQPVAVFVGGTSGIGEGLARVFAKHRAGNAHIIIVGRNRAAADKIISSFPTHPGATHEFVECDLLRMKNVRETAQALVARLPRLNFLVMTPGMMSMKGREETEDGIDKKLAVHYYARWRMLYELMPLLRKAKDAGEDAKVMTVLDSIRGSPVNLNDLGLKKTFSIGEAATQAPAYNDLMVQSFADQQPELTFVHAYPGIVHTPLVKGFNTTPWMRLVTPVVSGLSSVFATSIEDCGEYLLHGLYNHNKGACFIDNYGEDVVLAKKAVQPLDAKEKLWEHTLEATTV